MKGSEEAQKNGRRKDEMSDKRNIASLKVRSTGL